MPYCFPIRSDPTSNPFKSNDQSFDNKCCRLTLSSLLFIPSSLPHVPRVPAAPTRAIRLPLIHIDPSLNSSPKLMSIFRRSLKTWIISKPKKTRWFVKSPTFANCSGASLRKTLLRRRLEGGLTVFSRLESKLFYLIWPWLSRNANTSTQLLHTGQSGATDLDLKLTLLSKLGLFDVALGLVS